MVPLTKHSCYKLSSAFLAIKHLCKTTKTCTVFCGFVYYSNPNKNILVHGFFAAKLLIVVHRNQTHTHTHTRTHTYLPMVVYADQGRNQRYGDQPKYTCYRNSLMSACTLGSGLLKSIFISGPARN